MDKSSKPVIAITMGDPCGIGPEIIVKALADQDVHEACEPLIIGDMQVLMRAAADAGMVDVLENIDIRSITSLSQADMIYGAPTAASGDAVYRYICEATRLCMNGTVDAMATAPINKSAMNLAGHNYPGHTELLAELTDTKDFVMMLSGSRLRVTLVTIHEPLSAIPSLVTCERVLATIQTTNADLVKYFCKAPRIAVLALNPHAGEGGMFGSHEDHVIAPAIVEARKKGIDATGPHSADTLFHFAANGDYDAVVCMYHDQGLIPLKLLHFYDGVNITLGLPIIRTSVDHGTAYNLAGKGVASHESMRAAILEAVKMSKFRDKSCLQ